MKILFYAVIFLVPIFCALFFSLITLKKQKVDRRSPLTGKLLGGPGESLRAELEKNMEKIEGAYFRLLLIFFPPVALLMLFSYLGDNIVPIWQIVLDVLLYVGLIFWGTRNLYLILKERRNLYLGLDAELAVEKGATALLIPVACRRQLFDLSNQPGPPLGDKYRVVG